MVSPARHASQLIPALRSTVSLRPGGGIPLIEEGKIIGAIGCSGGTDSQDEVVSKAGAAVILAATDK